MTMPLDLVLVRHGESEGNLVTRQSKQGDDRAFAAGFADRHSSRWRLTDKGIWQSEEAKIWLQDNFLISYDNPFFDRYYVSWYLRAIETGLNLQLPKAHWYTEFYLRERDWGLLDVTPQKEKEEKFADNLQKRKADSFYWRPPNGESIADLCIRVDRVLATLHRECSRKRVIIVCHGEVMWAFRIRLERLTPYQFNQQNTSKNPSDKIHNCQIIHYSRVNPETKIESPYLNFKRSICPWDTTLSTNEWEPIIRPRYTNGDLAEIIAGYPRQID